jgi:hypothetical protein
VVRGMLVAWTGNDKVIRVFGVQRGLTSCDTIVRSIEITKFPKHVKKVQLITERS